MASIKTMDTYYTQPMEQSDSCLYGGVRTNQMCQEQSSSPVPGDMNPQEYGMSEWELENASLEEIKKKIAASGCGWAEEQMLLQWRRTLKSRSYTKKCRDKHRSQVLHLTREKQSLLREAQTLSREISQYQRLMREMK